MHACFSKFQKQARCPLDFIHDTCAMIVKALLVQVGFNCLNSPIYSEVRDPLGSLGSHTYQEGIGFILSKFVAGFGPSVNQDHGVITGL